MDTANDTRTATHLSVTSLERDIWVGLHADLERALTRLGLAHLTSPSMLILHELIDHAVLAMHQHVFLLLIETDFGMSLSGSEAQLETLYKAEVDEHGSQNIARYCYDYGWQVNMVFPTEGDDIVRITMPVAMNTAGQSTAKLVTALGYDLRDEQADENGRARLVTLQRSANKTAEIRLGGLLDGMDSQHSVLDIATQLGYGIMRFSGTGELISASPAMLTSARLEVNDAALTQLCAAIPLTFYNDVIWGLALSGQNGVFENYRIRIRGGSALDILYNVSGYRDQDGTIHSLWQVVSLEESNDRLAEGSILNQVRLHKITRSYVPQLVEEKAREAVRMGKDQLSNEECFVAVLFCDIVGFTSYVESNANSESIINTLNTILRSVSRSVRRSGGTIDKFMGDSVMAIFKDPADAIHAAQDMQNHSSDLNGLRLRAGQDPLQLRIGIHCGDVVIGNVGTTERLDWTAIGDVVNTASRIEKNCHPGAILVSQTMRDTIRSTHNSDSAIDFTEVFTLNVKGKREVLSVCHVVNTAIMAKAI